MPRPRNRSGDPRRGTELDRDHPLRISGSLGDDRNLRQINTAQIPSEASHQLTQEVLQLDRVGQIISDPAGGVHKLVIFTEHRDTLRYLINKIRTLLGRDESVVVIHGGLARADRRRAEEEFVNNPEVLVLVATDAAGEAGSCAKSRSLLSSTIQIFYRCTTHARSAGFSST